VLAGFLRNILKYDVYLTYRCAKATAVERFMEVQQIVSQQINLLRCNKFMRSGCGDLENLTFGSESRNYIN